MANSFDSRSTLKIGNQDFTLYRLAPVYQKYPQAERLPYSLKILLENLLRTEDGVAVLSEDIAALAQWDARAMPSREIAFTPSRVLLQDFTGVPAVVDLAAMRDAMNKMGGDPKRINPLQPVELVIDHSVQVDMFGTPQAFQGNTDLEYSRNRERYVFLRWGQNAFRNFRVVPPETGIVHQVNLEYLARVAFTNADTQPLASLYPDTLVGTDSHTTMVNGLGVLGWGVGGIEAEAAMLGQPVSMLIPQVLGFKLHGQLREGATATDLVLTVTQMLRKRGVVGMFVEFFGHGLDSLPLADRATIANMAPEYGATCGIFPVDAETLAYLRLTGRSPEQVRKVEEYFKEQGLFRTSSSPDAIYSDTMELDLARVEPSLAGPKRPQDRVALGEVRKSFFTALPDLQVKKTSAVSKAEPPKVSSPAGHPAGSLPPQHGQVVIAAITSCTNTSNPYVMLAAGLVAKKAVERGLQTKPWVKTSLAPGSKVVTEYFKQSDLMRHLEQLRFNLVGYGCTTCIAEGTPVLLGNGTARRIEQLPSAGGSVLFGPTRDGKLRMALQAEAMAQGVRDCIKLVLQDGRELLCTPDHKILCADGRWVRADELVLGADRVVVGLEAPLDEPGDDEPGWSLALGDMRLTMDTPKERLRTLAFARLLGHLLGDGSISALGQRRLTVGQAVDREAVLNDVELLTGKRPTAARYDERKWTIVLPATLTAAIVSLPGVRTGRRIDQPASLPAFVLDERCPVAVVREYLGGVFGADGHAPILHRLSERPTDATLSAPAYSQSARPEHVAQLEQVMRDLLHLLARCGVKTQGVNLLRFATRRSASTYAAPRDGSTRVEVRFNLPDGLSFVERVGFRYCVGKALRASAAAVYWRTVARINRQRLEVSAQLRDLHQREPRLSFNKARALAAATLTARETVLFPHDSLLEGHDRFDRMPAATTRTFRPLHRDRCGFPSPLAVLTELGVRHWFAPLLARDQGDFAKRYCVDKTAQELPTFSLTVLDRRPAGPRPVFDLAVDDLHAFIAGSVAVHNCIGNSGPLPPEVSATIADHELVVVSVLSGNRNFEGRVHPEVRANYLASPPLVVAYALAGRIDIDFETEPLGDDKEGRHVYLRDLWPTQREVIETVRACVRPEMFAQMYSDVFNGDSHWRHLDVPTGDLFEWRPGSTYVKNPPYFDDMPAQPAPVVDVRGARVLAVLGDSITTDHISPAGSIKKDSPAGKYLIANHVTPAEFNSYGARRGNHEVMIRGTFANVRLKNRLAPGTEGGFTRHLPDGEQMTIFDASEKYRADGVPLVILAGKEYGSGSSRDWAAKGPRLLGVRVVIAESFERIHRSNLVGMGVLPLQFKVGENVDCLGLTGEEVYDLQGLPDAVGKDFNTTRMVTVHAKRADGTTKSFQAHVRIDTPQEVQYYLHGGILQYVLRQMLARN